MSSFAVGSLRSAFFRFWLVLGFKTFLPLSAALLWDFSAFSDFAITITSKRIYHRRVSESVISLSQRCGDPTCKRLTPAFSGATGDVERNHSNCASWPP